ncbi:hypothetical protein [Cellvibrio sp.]
MFALGLIGLGFARRQARK